MLGKEFRDLNEGKNEMLSKEKMNKYVRTHRQVQLFSVCALSNFKLQMYYFRRKNRSMDNLISTFGNTLKGHKKGYWEAG